MKHDLEKYRPYLKDQNLTREQEDEFIHSLFSALEKLADRAFAIDPVSLVMGHESLEDSFDHAKTLRSPQSNAAKATDTP